MDKFDIFERFADGTSIWLGEVDGLEEARKRISGLAIIKPGEFLIYSDKKGLVVEHQTADS